MVKSPIPAENGFIAPPSRSGGLHGLRTTGLNSSMRCGVPVTVGSARRGGILPQKYIFDCDILNVP